MDEYLRLIHEAQSGDLEALMKLLEAHSEAIRRQIDLLIPNRFRSILDADDVLQETLSEAVFGIIDFDPKTCFNTWLMSVAKHNLVDAIRGLNAAKRGGKIRILTNLEGSRSDEHYDQLLSMLPGSDTPPSGKLQREERKIKILEWIDRLPSNFRNVIDAYDLKELSAEETGKLLGCSPGAVFMRRARALEKLRLLAEQADFYKND